MFESSSAEKNNSSSSFSSSSSSSSSSLNTNDNNKLRDSVSFLVLFERSLVASTEIAGVITYYPQQGQTETHWSYNLLSACGREGCISNSFCHAIIHFCTSEYSLRQLLLELHTNVDMECSVERDVIQEPFSEEPYQLVGSAISDPLDDYKKVVVGLIDEYFSTGDVQVAAIDLKDPGKSEYHPYFVKRLVSMSMDIHDKEKDMASVLLSALYADVISSVHISQGFVLLLEAADDLVIDILDEVGVLALFVSRAVVDDILPPAFLSRATKVLPESSKGVQVIQTSEKSYLSAPHHAEFVECIDLSV